MTLSKYSDLLDAQINALNIEKKSLRQKEAEILQNKKYIEVRLEKMYARMSLDNFEEAMGLIPNAHKTEKLRSSVKKDLMANRIAQIRVGVEQVVVCVPNRLIHALSRTTAYTCNK
jgi:hypothetical protein